MTSNSNTPHILWQAAEADKENSHMHRFMKYVETRLGVTPFADYAEFHQWSVQNLQDFWLLLYQYFEVKDDGRPDFILQGKMPDSQWFGGSKVNYAEHLMRHADEGGLAIRYIDEVSEVPLDLSWAEVRDAVGKCADYLRSLGLKAGDTICAFMPNVPETSIFFLATTSIGAVWSSCSPDFGSASVLDRFSQIHPKVLLATDGYRYGGKTFSKIEVVRSLIENLLTLQAAVIVPNLGIDAGELSQTAVPCVHWPDLMERPAAPISFEAVDFSHPLWVLYSSGTTGKPKAITHSHGGILLEHLKYIHFHNEVKPGENFFWYTTTGWMMWNFLHAAWLAGAAVVLYEGSPAYPDLKVLWNWAERLDIHHFGTSAPYLVSCMKNGLDLGAETALPKLRSIGSTGAPLPAEAFDYIYQSIKSEVWLCSMAGGTDVCTAFVGGCILEPVRSGEIQVRGLGCDLVALDDDGRSVINQVGEMVIRQPMPSMPIYFWNDATKEKYRASYFDTYPDFWRHGDWTKIAEHGGLTILGRSDATLNRQGIRIGTAEIYASVNKIPEIEDSMVLNLELEYGAHFMPLFVKMRAGFEISDDIKKKVAAQLRADYTPRHVPDVIIPVPDIPYTISGKKMEAPTKKILMGMDISQSLSKDAMRNPDSLQFFMDFEMAPYLK